MKLILALMILSTSVGCNCSKKAQPSGSVDAPVESSTGDNSVMEEPVNPIGVFFTSMASGPADDSFLKEWISGYMQKHQISIAADKYSGCGKEGEYVIVMTIGKTGSAKILDFKAALEKRVDEQEVKNKTESPSSGPINIEYGVKQDRYDYCRLGSAKWL